jgi:hypothetical protein
MRVLPGVSAGRLMSTGCEGAVVTRRLGSELAKADLREQG